jgi:hypothetical protein
LLNLLPSFSITKTHQKDAVVQHQAYAGLPVGPTQGERKEPYTLSVQAKTVRNITRDWKQNLVNAVTHELGKGINIAFDKITSHKSAHYYGHFLRLGDGIAVRVPKECPKVRELLRL